VANFRIELAKAESDAAPTAENKELDSRIFSRLREFNVGTAGPTRLLGEKDSRSDLSRAHLEQKTTPAVILAEKEILSSEPFSRNAGGPGDVLPSASKTRKIRFAPADPESLPIVLPVKISPSAAPPELSDGQAPRPASPLPLLPLAVAAGLGVAGYGVSQSKSSYVSAEGLDREHPGPQGPYQRLVANTLLGGAAAIVVVVAGSAAITAVTPIVIRYAPPAIEQGVRLAGSEAGSINPVDASEAAPEAEAEAIEVEQIVIRRGEILNRVWHSQWEENSAMSGPKGQSYCRGHWLPIHALSATTRRGLDIDGVFNNAQKGSIFVVTDDITAIVRRSIGGVEEEILIPLADSSKLVEMSRSNIPQGSR
jgi:hypothetical protein